MGQAGFLPQMHHKFALTCDRCARPWSFDQKLWAATGNWPGTVTNEVVLFVWHRQTGETRSVWECNYRCLSDHRCSLPKICICIGSCTDDRIDWGHRQCRRRSNIGGERGGEDGREVLVSSVHVDVHVDGMLIVS